jgi:hypothetical protein
MSKKLVEALITTQKLSFAWQMRSLTLAAGTDSSSTTVTRNKAAPGTQSAGVFAGGSTDAHCP